MGKHKKDLGVKRKRGKKFVWQESKPVEMKKVQSKSMFRDKRLGEQDPSLDAEHKALLRFTRERAQASRKKHRFDLDDSIQLTHKGQPLEQLHDDYIDQDLNDSDEDQPRKKPKLDDRVVASAHFGQGSKKHDAYAEMIEKSKEHKQQRQLQKEENFEMTVALNRQFDTLKAKLKYRNKTLGEDLDDYDKFIQELKENNEWLEADDERQHKLSQVNAARQKFVEQGEDWTVPESLEEFVAKLGSNPHVSLQNMKEWNAFGATKRERAQEMTRLIEFILEFLGHDWDLEGVYASGQIDELVDTLKALCKEDLDTTINMLSSLGSTERELDLNYVCLYHLVGALFDPSREDTLTALYLGLSNYMLLYFDLVTPTHSRDFLLLCYTHWTVWMKPHQWFSPELVRGLKRLLDTCEEEPYTATTLAAVFPTGEPSTLFSLTYDLFKQLYTVFVQDKGIKSLVTEFNSYFPETLQLPVPSPDGAMQLTCEQVKEISTYEPKLFGKITSLKHAKDSNKDSNERKALKLEHKRGQKATMKVLQKEAQAYEQEQMKQRRLFQEKQAEEQKRVRNLLDELQADYKRVMTSNETVKRKKKKSQRKAGKQF